MSWDDCGPPDEILFLQEEQGRGRDCWLVAGWLTGRLSTGLSAIYVTMCVRVYVHSYGSIRLTDNGIAGFCFVPAGPAY